MLGEKVYRHKHKRKPWLDQGKIGKSYVTIPRGRLIGFLRGIRGSFGLYERLFFKYIKHEEHTRLTSFHIEGQKYLGLTSLKVR